MSVHKSPTVAGIDIGGDRKGCHLVILRDSEVICSTVSKDAQELHAACLAHDVLAVGIDSPCMWSAEGAGRSCERELARERIFSFSTPTRERALASTSGFYGWMFNGEKVYQAFAPTHPVMKTTSYQAGRVSFETFPHAVTCAMLGKGVASAKLKRTQRRALLEQLGISTAKLKSIDAVDAALCALTARCLVQGSVRAYGDTSQGLIFVPAI